MTNATATRSLTAKQADRAQATMAEQAALVTPANVGKYPTTQLVAMYNAVSGKAPIKAFHTRTKGEAQLLAIVAAGAVTIGTKPAHAERRPSKGTSTKPGAVPQPTISAKGADVMGAMAATLNPEDAEAQAIAAVSKAKAAGAPKAAAAPRGPKVAAMESVARSVVLGYTITVVPNAPYRARPGSLRAALLAAVLAAPTAAVACAGSVTVDGKTTKVSTRDVLFAAAQGLITVK